MRARRRLRADLAARHRPVGRSVPGVRREGRARLLGAAHVPTRPRQERAGRHDADPGPAGRSAAGSAAADDRPDAGNAEALTTPRPSASARSIGRGVVLEGGPHFSLDLPPPPRYAWGSVCPVEPGEVRHAGAPRGRSPAAWPGPSNKPDRSSLTQSAATPRCVSAAGHSSPRRADREPRRSRGRAGDGRGAVIRRGRFLAAVVSLRCHRRAW